MGALAFLVACEAAPTGFSLCRASCMGNRRRAVRRSGVRPAFCVCALRIVLFLVLWAACDLHISRVPCGLRKGAVFIRAFVEAKNTAASERCHVFQEKRR